MTTDRAIEILNPEHREHYDSLDEVNEACRMGMEALKRQRWIRADEYEPEADEFVLAIVSGEPTPYEVLENGYVLAMVTDEGWMLPEWPEWRSAEVHYWMPLPEPPKEGGRKCG